ncbi:MULTISPECIES: GNAT family N-acetyltransferase [unclassified Rubrivivax]|uniref:GNAT family N-acetyltransferase n=1 Tax=unclassified Rubrivivax TaxID=2649762 RepID=UPI001E318AE2|nr:MULTISPECIES: GNAT family N-acetyltransferase [unclassified Rubrivivax]MCC9598538.1 GNAT family N-acetyltransferase [Rubrivivax sp. JA1055]MCC9648239.1 GNAT family N-acetyltransferase [Rubrivivax sp. JA1029]
MKTDSEMPGPAPDAAAQQWVPIRKLADRHRPRVLQHLLGLEGQDRYLRFGYAAGDHQIEQYVARLDFERDELFGVFNRRLELVAVAHLAHLGDSDRPGAEAEFGVSVSARARGRGWGSRLFALCTVHARNRGVYTLLIHALAENSAMLRIARNAGAEVGFDGPDAVARVYLPPQDIASHVEAMVEQQVADLDYGLKRHARRFDRWLNLWGSVGTLPDLGDANVSHAARRGGRRDRGPTPPV